MTDRDLYQHLHKAFDAFAAKPSGEVFLDMQRSGLIDAEGELQNWDAFLAIVATNATDNRQATYFRCRKPTLGLPGRAEIDIRRELIIKYLKEGKRIITVIVDEETRGLHEGAEVHLTSHETIRTDRNDIKEDNLGNLPAMFTVKSVL